MIRNLYWFSYNVPLFSSNRFSKHSDIRFHEDPSCGSRIVPYGRTERRIDVTKLIVCFRNFANAPRKEPLFIPDKYSNFPE